MLTNRCGERLQRFETFPFGEAIAELPQNPEKMRLTGHQRDLNQPSTTEDDLDYMHARYYGTKMGRFLGVDRGSPTLGLAQTWNRYHYARGNPLRFLDPDGNDEVEYGETRLTIFPGEVLVVKGRKEGDYHVATYVGGGKPGQIMVVENSPGRNTDTSQLGPATVEKLPDNTGNSHPPVDLLALQVNGEPNPYHPDNGGKALGVVQHDGPPLTGERVKAAAATVTMTYMSPPDYKQCTHFVLDLAQKLRVRLILAPKRRHEDPDGVGRFVRAVASPTENGGLPPAP
jgi:RHS repeat-associated protein